jgi:hypothetical protein
MTWKKLPEDSFFFGMAFGGVILFAVYYILTAIRTLLIYQSGNPFLMAPPRVQLFTIVINIILFRYIVLKLDREKTGRGLLFITLIAAFAYFYLFFHMRTIQ